MALELIAASIPRAKALKQPTDEQVEALAARLRCEDDALERWVREPGLETIDEFCERHARAYLVEDLNPLDYGPTVRTVRIGERWIGSDRSRGPLGLD